MSEDRDDLPTGWASSTVGYLFKTETGSTPPKVDEDNYGTFIPLVKPPELQGGVIYKAPDGLSQSGALKARILPPESVLVSCIGNLGKTAINREPVAFNQQINAILPAPNIAYPRFVLYQVQSPHFLRDLNDQASATTISIVNKSKFNALTLKLAPLPEQARIVSKIEELFSSIDEGERALERVRKLLERYRQSVLKAAVTGELTREWREQHLGDLESGEVMLARILEARRKAWEAAELAKMTAKNRLPLNDAWKKKYVAPPPPDIADLPELPPSWTWASLGSLIVVGPQNGVYIPQAKYGSGTPIIRIDDFQTDWIRPVGELRRVQATDQDCLTYGVKRADLIINRVNSVSHLGKCMLVPEDFDGALFESNMMRCSVSDLVVKEVLVAYLNSEFGRRRATKNCKHAVNQASINQDDVAEIPIPLPPLAEQQALADAIRLEMSKLPDDFDGVSKLAAALRQSLLRDAFAGLIVPQDPTDEPASTLLERIAAQRADRESSRKRVPKPLRRKNAKA